MEISYLNYIQWTISFQKLAHGKDAMFNITYWEGNKMKEDEYKRCHEFYASSNIFPGN